MTTPLNFRTSLIVAAFAGAACLAGSARADGVVVVSAKSAAKPLTADQAADLFLGRSNELPGAGTATPIDLSEGAALRDEFYEKVAGKSAPQLKAYWSKQIFSGKGQPPKAVGDSAAVKGLLAGNPNLVGYIDKSAVDASVKVLLNFK
jgi:hypothetical protein